jgi:hypothetical protein
MTDESRLYIKIGQDFTSHERLRIRMVSTFAATCIPTRLKATSQSSKRECVASINTVKRGIYIGIWRHTIFATTTDPHSVTMTWSVRRLQLRARAASVSRIGNLTSKSFGLAAARFLRWRKRRRRKKRFVLVCLLKAKFTRRDSIGSIYFTQSLASKYHPRPGNIPRDLDWRVRRGGLISPKRQRKMWK